jgi:cell division GTPase FtsZ
VALNWKSLSVEHVRQAIQQVAASPVMNRTSGIVIVAGDRQLPAKEVLRVAYRIANHLPSDATVKFSSGDATLNVLTRLGFSAKRIGNSFVDVNRE